MPLALRGVFFALYGDGKMIARIPQFAVITLFLCFPVAAHCGKYNPTLSIGDAAPEWKSLPGVDGAEHSLSDLKDKPAIVVVFTCNSCPYAVDYEDRTIALAKKFSDQVVFVAINVNLVPEDNFEKMKERAKAKDFPYPYLFDKTQQIAKDYGATFTPEFFLLDRDRKIVFMGGMDDNSNADAVTNRYLENAIVATLKGEVVKTAEAEAPGCRVRYKRERR
jgi:thiol-disulfide isomerase/thioredoxin